MVRMHAAHIAFAGLAMLLAFSAHAANHIVGGESGWTSAADYGGWAASQTFAAGDTLAFNYGGQHSVYQVSKSDYQSCSTGAAITSDASGSTVIRLSKPGTTYFFICGISSHCLSGMKLAVTTATSDGFSSSGSGAVSNGSDGGSSSSPSTLSKAHQHRPVGRPGLLVASVLGLGFGLVAMG